MTTVQQLIEAGYARSTSNDPGKLAGDAELIAHLNRKYQSLFSILAVLGEDTTLAKTVLNFAGGPPATVALPTDLIDISHLEQANGAHANLIPMKERDRTWHLAPSMFRQGNSLVSRGLSGDPGPGTAITLYYLDAPAALTVLASLLDVRFPSRYENILVLDIAIYLSVKDEERDEKDYKALKDEYSASMAAFNMVVQKGNTAKDRA